MADDELKIPDDDDWLNDLDSDPGLDAPETGLDESVFDEMFDEAAGRPGSAPESAQSAAGEGESGSGELSQSDIDAMLGGADTTQAEDSPPAAEPAPAASSSAAGEEGAPGAEAAAAASAAGEEGSGSGELSQSDIDAMLGGTDASQAGDAPPAAEPAPAASSPAAGDAGGSFVPEDLPPAADIDDAAMAFEEEDGDELDALFADEDDSAGIGGPEEEPSAGGTDAGSVAAGGSDAGSIASDGPQDAAGAAPAPDPGEVDAATVVEPAPAPAGWKAALAALAANRKVLAAASGGAVVLISLLLFLLFHGGGEKEAAGVKAGAGKTAPARARTAQAPAAPARTAQAPAAPAPAARPAAAAAPEKNHPPAAVAAAVVLPVDRDRVAVKLAGRDPDNDQLNFEVTSLPAHGVLSGDPPDLVYVAGRDFSGEDSFSFRVTDKEAASEPVTVTVRREKRSASGIRTITPRRPIYRAAPLRLSALSTKALRIDGRRLWRDMNPGIPPGRGMRLEVRGRTGHGRLHRVSAMVFRYDPDPYDHGVERLRYRFIGRRARSKPAELVIEVKNGDPPPEARFAALAAPFYRVGERVVVDAGPSRDDDRAGLRFRWLQKAGVDIRLDRLNREGSRVAFVVPSYFYTTPYPEPVLIVEVRDASGQVSRAEIRIPVRREERARRWNGLRQVEYGYPEARVLLPWSVAD